MCHLSSPVAHQLFDVIPLFLTCTCSLGPKPLFCLHERKTGLGLLYIYDALESFIHILIRKTVHEI